MIMVWGSKSILLDLIERIKNTRKYVVMCEEETEERKVLTVILTLTLIGGD